MHTDALLKDLYESHITLLLASRSARWDRHSELLLEEEQLRAEEELTLAEGTAELTLLLPKEQQRASSSRALAMRCTVEAPADTATVLTALIEEHRRASGLAEQLSESAESSGEENIGAVASRLAFEHDQAALALETLRRRVQARRNSARRIRTFGSADGAFGRRASAPAG